MKGFLSSRGTKRSKSFWIYEYFNNGLAKILIQKTASDYIRQLKEKGYEGFKTSL